MKKKFLQLLLRWDFLCLKFYFPHEWKKKIKIEERTKDITEKRRRWEEGREFEKVEGELEKEEYEGVRRDENEKRKGRKLVEKDAKI